MSSSALPYIFLLATLAVTMPLNPYLTGPQPKPYNPAHPPAFDELVNLRPPANYSAPTTTTVAPMVLNYPMFGLALLTAVVMIVCLFLFYNVLAKIFTGRFVHVVGDNNFVELAIIVLEDQEEIPDEEDEHDYDSLPLF